RSRRSSPRRHRCEARTHPPRGLRWPDSTGAVGVVPIRGARVSRHPRRPKPGHLEWRAPRRRRRSMVDEQLVGEVVEAIAPLPDVDGGLAIVIATASSPPAVAMLSTGDVAVVGTTVRVGLIAGSSVGRRLGGAF